MGNHKPPSTIILFILISVASVAAVIYTPALPQIKSFFNIDSDKVSWAVNLFLLGYAVGQLIYAPLSNRFNRRHTLFCGLSLASVGAGICILSYYLQNYYVLLLGLLVTSLGSCAGLTLAFTIINDVYDAHQSRKVIPMVTLSFSIMPGLGVFVGSFLVDRFYWPVCFVFLLGYFLFVGLLVYLLPETCKRTDPNALQLSNIYGRFKEVFSSGKLWYYSLLWGFCTSIVYIFAATAPLVVITQMQVDPSVYGMFTLITSFGLLSGTLFTRLMVSLLSPVQMMISGLLIGLVGSVSFVLLSLFTVIGPWEIFCCMFFVFFGLPAIFTTASSLAAKGQNDKASASSVMTFINMGVTVALFFGVTLLPGDPERVLPEVVLVILLAIALFIFSSRYLSLGEEA